MKRSWFVAICLIALASISAIAAADPSTARAPAFPRILANARYVYVSSYDGDQFEPNLLPEDQAAISAVQKAIQEWGKLILVYQPSQADIIILVTSPTFRRLAGSVRRTPMAKWQFSLARHGKRWSPSRRNTTGYAI